MLVCGAIIGGGAKKSPDSVESRLHILLGDLLFDELLELLP